MHIPSLLSLESRLLVFNHLRQATWSKCCSYIKQLQQPLPPASVAATSSSCSSHFRHFLKGTKSQYLQLKVWWLLITCTHANMHTQMHTCTHAHMHTCTHAHMHTCTHAHMHTCKHANMHTQMHKCTHAYMHTCTHAHMHTHNSSKYFCKPMLQRLALVMFWKDKSLYYVHTYIQ